MNEEPVRVFPDNTYNGYNEWTHPPQCISESSGLSYYQKSTYEVGWNANSNAACHGTGGGGYTFQNYDTGWNNNHGHWNVRYNGRMTRGGIYMRQRGYGSKKFNGTMRNVAGGGNHYCDSCDRGFATAEDLQNHQQNDHIVCGLDGCSLSAHPKIVEKHQKMQHESGLYCRIASAASQNPEDVKKWIAERKRNYPTKENIERRKREEEECLQRGESLGLRRGRGNRFGRQRGGPRYRGGGRGIHASGKQGEENKPRRGRGFGGGIHRRRFNNRNFKNNRATRGRGINKVPFAQQVVDSEDDEPKNLLMFPGTAHVLGITLEKCQSSDEESEDAGSFSDSEWQEEKRDSGVATEGRGVNVPGTKEVLAPISNEIAITNALGILMGTYASDDSDEDAAPKPMKTQAVKMDATENCGLQKEESRVEQFPVQTEKPSACAESNTPGKGNSTTTEAKEEEEEVVESDGSAPEEVPIIRREDAMPGVGEVKVTEKGDGLKEKDEVGLEGSKGRKTKRCRKRARGKESVDAKEEENPPNKSSAENPKRQCALGIQPLRPRPPTLLEELLKNEIRHERNVILQCIRYVANKNFFDQSMERKNERECSTIRGEKEETLCEDGASINNSLESDTGKCSSPSVKVESSCDGGETSIENTIIVSAEKCSFLSTENASLSVADVNSVNGKLPQKSVALAVTVDNTV